MQGLVGDCTDNVVLLQSLAEKFRNTGQSEIAIGLLKRATQQVDCPISGAHAEAALVAKAYLAEVLVGYGLFDEALEHYKFIASVSSVPIPGVTLPPGIKDGIRAVKVGAATAGAELLSKLGRYSEAEALLAVVKM